MGLQDAKLLVMQFTGLEKDALHIYIGLMVFFGSALLFRWRVGKAGPLLVAAMFAVGGEIWDVVDNVRGGMPMLWAGHWHDVWNTLFWPVVITLLARWTRVFRQSV